MFLYYLLKINYIYLFSVEVEYMNNMAKGARLLRINKFTYAKKYQYKDKKMLWMCSAKNCKSTAITSNDILTKHDPTHNHDPPKYYETKEGFYIKIK